MHALQATGTQIKTERTIYLSPRARFSPFSHNLAVVRIRVVRVHPQHCASQTIKKKHAFTDVTAATVVGHQTALREFTRLSPPLVRISGHSRDPVYKTAGQLMPSEASPNSLRLHTCFAFL